MSDLGATSAGFNQPMKSFPGPVPVVSSWCAAQTREACCSIRRPDRKGKILVGLIEIMTANCNTVDGKYSAYVYLIFERISAMPERALETIPGSEPGLSITI